MTMEVNGTAGIDFDVTESDDALTTGTIVQNHKVQTDISDIVLANTDLVASLSGTIGTTNVDFNLLDLVSQSGGSGAGVFDISVIRNHNVPFGTIKSIVIHNKSVNVLELHADSQSFFIFGNNNNSIEIQPNTAMSFVYPTAFPIPINPVPPATPDPVIIELVGTVSAGNALEIYILGTP